jgi:dTDP-4-dehydrorhamnose 3,5-epimerase
MQIRELKVGGAREITPQVFGDDRGSFREWFKADRFREATGHDFGLAQANCSVSARGVLRGLHFASVPPGQAKYVTCLSGAILDVVVDLRVGSPTFGAWDAVRLDPDTKKAVYLPEGLGHGFVSLEDGTTVVYLCSEPYAPSREFEVDPFDPAIGIEWPDLGVEPQLSAKDAAAPSLAEAQAQGLLPSYDECVRYVEGLREA